MQIDPHAWPGLVDLLEEPGPLPAVCAALAQRLKELSGAEAVGILQRLGDCPLLIGQAGGLNPEDALALVDEPASSWSVLDGHLVARGVAGEASAVLSLGARLLAGHLTRRLERNRTQRIRESVSAATHAMNNTLVTLFAHESCPNVMLEAQRLKLRLDCLRSLRGKDRIRDLQHVPAFLDRVREFLGYTPGGEFPVHVECSLDVQQRVVGLGVDLLPALLNAGYALRAAGSEVFLRAELNENRPCFTLDVEAEDPGTLVADLELPVMDSVDSTVRVDQGRVLVTMQVVQAPGVLLLHGPAPLGALTSVLEALGVDAQPCATIEEVAEHVRADAERWVVVVTEDAQALGRKLRRNLLLQLPTFALRSIFFEGGPPLPGADVRKQIDLAALLAEARSGRPVAPGSP